jgi:hemolysin activation/secretion protein
MILASRIAASTSVGNRRVLYFLGGVDSWLYQPKTDEIYSQPSDPAFLYQALVSPMRGFFKGVRSGNSFVVINNEIRIPVAKLLSKQPIKSEFLETFQLVPFIDFGTAWTGKNPFSDENDFNTQTFGGNGNPITVTIETQESPIVMGRGIGVHAKVLGYFIRADWAWGYIDNQQFDRTFYLSLSLDF